jgi:protein gp37
MKLAGTRLQHHPSRAGLTRMTKTGPVWTGEVRFNEAWLTEPLRWKRPRRIFVCAHGDLFHEDVPDEWIDRVFAVMALAPHHQFQVLTKRSARMREWMSRAGVAGNGRSYPGHTILAAMDGLSRAKWPDLLWPLPNVWLGVSVEDQARADERVPDLLATPAAVRWLSCEPLLGPVDLEQWLICPNARDGLLMDPSTGQYECCAGCDWTGLIGGLDWVVAGGESGAGARPMHPDWARSLRDQCTAAGVPFLFKQWGGYRPLTAADKARDACGATRVPCDVHGPGFMRPATKKAAGRLLDGVEHSEFPA